MGVGFAVDSRKTRARSTFYAELSDHEGLRDALRQRVEQLNVSRTCLDEITGLPSGYVSKILAPYGRKRIGGLSLGLIVQAAGLKMVLVDDPAARKRGVRGFELDHLLRAAGLKMLLVEGEIAAAKFESLYEPRHAKQVRLNNDSRRSMGRAIATERQRRAARSGWATAKRNPRRSW
jgi:hypothetical protein